MAGHGDDGATSAGRRAGGFTLIELVVVITILGLLAALALPRFTDSRRDSRLMVLDTVLGALRTAAAQGYAMCITHADTCRPNVQGDLPNTTGSLVTFNGASYQFNRGYPIAWGSSGSYPKGIESLVEMADISIEPYVALTYYRDFRVTTAPDPANCYVRYSQTAFTTAGQPVLLKVSSGC